MTTHLHHAASSYVFRLLGRQRTKAQRASGSTLGEVLATLQEGGQNALIEIELPSGSLGRLLVQVGRLVFVHHENSVAAAALAELRREAEGASLYSLHLSDEQIILACAALAGIPLALGEALEADPENLTELLTQLGKQSFTGVVALEQGLQTLIWRFQRGRVLNSVDAPSRLRSGRLTQIVWQEQLLPEVGHAESGSDTTYTAAAHTTAAYTAAQTKPTLQAASGQNTPTRSTSTQNTVAQNIPVQNISVRSTPISQTRSARQQPGTDEVWERFQSVLYAQLGGRAERVFALMRRELSGFSRADLIERLARQVERVAGSAAARNFRDGF